MTDEPSASYQPGGWVALAGSHSWVLVDADPSGSLVSELWHCVRRGSGPHAVTDTLQLQCEQEKPSFGLVEETESSLVIALGGRVVAEVSTGGAQERVGCPPFARSVEYRLERVPAAVRIFSSAGHSPGARLPLRGGVVQADEMLIEWEAAPGKDRLRTVESRSRREPSGADGEAGGRPGTGREPGERRTAATLPAVSLARFRLGEAAGELGGADEVDGSPPPAEPVGPGGAYDHLFGHTVQRAVEDAAIRSGEHEAASADPPAPPPAASTAPGQTPTESAEPTTLRPITTKLVEPAQPTAAVAQDEGIIDAIPWAGLPTYRGDHRPAAEPNAQTDVVELTISRAEQLAIVAQMESTGPPVPGPTVHAVLCPAEHPNPAHADICRVCGDSIADQAQVTVARPSLGMLRMSTGDVISLDRGVILGRSPAAERPVGGEGPHFVMVPSPGNDISRRHLELSLDGWHVLVTDLDSTNGTLVTRPGREPERLRPQQPTMIEPGTVVTLADEVSFRFEATS